MPALRVSLDSIHFWATGDHDWRAARQSCLVQAGVQDAFGVIPTLHAVAQPCVRSRPSDVGCLQLLVDFAKWSVTAGRLRSQVFALFLKLMFLGIARLGWVECLVFQGPTRAFHQPLFRQDARLQSTDHRINAGILFLGASVEEERDQGSSDKHGNGRQAAKAKRFAVLR
jgi:hypothetical protein